MTPAPRLILLDESDTVLVCVTQVMAGDKMEIDGASVVARETIPVGHKVARRDLRAGEQVVKYGAPIGSTTQPLAVGSWVHVHNMKSDYIASHSRAAADVETE